MTTLMHQQLEFEHILCIYHSQMHHLFISHENEESVCVY